MNPRKPVILCVDDEAANLKLLENILVPRGYEVVGALNGKDALAMILARAIDLVLLDVMMPGMDGFEVCRQIKEDPRLRNIPVVMITALTAKQDLIRGIEAGAEEFLSKPFNQTEALARIKILLRVKELSDDRRRAEEALQKSHDELEFKVRERTAELAKANEKLQADIIDLKRAEDRNQRQLEHLTALSAIDRVIASNFDLRISFAEILRRVKAELGIDATDILVLNPTSQMLEFAAGLGFHGKEAEKAQIRSGESHAGRAVLDRQLVEIPNLKDQPDHSHLTRLRAGEGFVSYYAVPLIAKGEVRGVLEVFARAALEPDAEWLDFLKALAGQAAIAIDNTTMFDSLQRSNSELIAAYDATIEGWSRALDLRDRETEGHSRRVTEMTVRLARDFNLSEAELVQVRWGALLHDIGKMGIADVILLKPGPLTAEEWVLMRRHPAIAYEMLTPVRYLRLALDIPHCHHEKWDGSGYPQGLRGEQIPLTARIFAVVDVWDAMRSDRPYRAGRQEEEVRATIRSLAGTHFDPRVVDMFLKLDPAAGFLKK